MNIRVTQARSLFIHRVPLAFIVFQAVFNCTYCFQPIIFNRVLELQGNSCCGVMQLFSLRSIVETGYTAARKRHYRNSKCNKETAISAKNNSALFLVLMTIAVLKCDLSQVTWSPLAMSRNELHLDLNHSPSYPLMPILLSCEDKSDNNPPESSKTLQNPSISEEF